MRGLRLIFGISLTVLTAWAFAGEDSTHRWHCNGPGYYETPGGLAVFTPAASDCDSPKQERLAEPQDAKKPAFGEGEMQQPVEQPVKQG